MNIALTVEAGDALRFDADVLVAKYAQQPHGLDLAIINGLTPGQADQARARRGEHGLVQGPRKVAARDVLFVGVEPLHQFSYVQIRDFARRALTILRDARPGAVHVALTLHGVGYGLDEVEAFRSELAGLFDALTTGQFPPGLKRITLIERDARRAQRMSGLLAELIPSRGGEVTGEPSLRELPPASQETLRKAGYEAASKPHVFVAMPFAPAFEDRYYYGIDSAVRNAGYLCERADLCAFVGDVMQWVQSRISTARLVVADLTGANPNVYLEVGYAWALRIPTVLLVEKAEDLKFDVRGQRVIEYNGSIRTLEERLARELQALQQA